MACNIDIDIDFESTQIIKKKIVVAKKNHKCDECNYKIEPGEKYEYIFGKSDDGIFENTTCRSCIEIRDLFFSNYTYGIIWDDIFDYIIENAWNEEKLSEDCISKLNKRAKGKICDYIQECWDNWDD